MIRRLIWQIAYARLCMTGRYKLSLRDAVSEARHSWDYWNGERPEGQPMPKPADIIREDAFEWERR